MNRALKTTYQLF